MTALSEALVAAQRSALAAMQKQYVAGRIDADTARSFMNASGLADTVDQDRLLFTLDALSAWGVEPETNGAPEKMSDKQRGFIEQLAREKNLPLPEDFGGMTKAQAHDAINALQDGSYDPAKYRVPF